MMHRVAATLAVGVVVLLVSGAQAQTRTDSQAMVQFKQGIELYKERKFDQAAIAFERAYELKPSFKILFNLGQAENERGQYASALQAYTRYLAEGGTAVPRGRLRKVKSEIERLNALVGMIVVAYDQDGVAVFVDGKRQGETPLEGPLLVDLGDREVSLRKGMEEIYSEVVRVAGGERVTVEMTFMEQEPGAASPAEDSIPTTEPEEPAKPRIWTWIAIGVGGAAAVGAVITGSIASSKAGTLEDGCPNRQCPESEWETLDSTRDLALATNILIGVAAAGVAAGIVLFFVEPGLSENEAAVSVGASPATDGALVSLSGRF